MKFPKAKSLLSMALLCAATAGQAAPLPPAVSGLYEVFANANSSTGGTGLTVGFLTAGQSFSLSSGILDLANSGAPQGFSDANGLSVTNRVAIAGDDSGMTPGTVIGQNHGLHSQGGLSAPYGALVGQFNGGNFFFVGRSFSGAAPSAGVLSLSYFDNGNSDNTGSYRVTFNTPAAAVPEPETYALMLSGLAVVGFVARRRQR